jgi:hypothetical protein
MHPPLPQPLLDIRNQRIMARSATPERLAGETMPERQLGTTNAASLRRKARRREAAEDPQALFELVGREAKGLPNRESPKPGSSAAITVG